MSPETAVEGTQRADVCVEEQTEFRTPSLEESEGRKTKHTESRFEFPISASMSNYDPRNGWHITRRTFQIFFFSAVATFLQFVRVRESNLRSSRK